MNFHPVKQLFQVAGAGDRTADPWVTSPMLPPTPWGLPLHYTYLLPYSLSFFFQAQITDRVRHFLSEPVSVQVTVARNYSLIFPAITICNKVGV